MAEKILIVEDEVSLRETLSNSLGRQGYSVDTVSDGQTALNLIRRSAPDLIVLDIMLPVTNGFEVCRIIRQEMKVPIMMLTSHDNETDRIIGLEMGADDYITKPFGMREFLARVKALLRRHRLDHSEMDVQTSLSKTLTFGDIEIDTTQKELRLKNQVVSLKPKEYELLLFLARHHNEVLSRKLILERVWGWDFSGGARTIDVHVHWLREKIEPDPNQPVRIVTVRGAGYRFEG